MRVGMIADEVSSVVPRSQERLTIVVVSVATNHKQRSLPSVCVEHVENRPNAFFGGEMYSIPPVKVIHRDRELRRRRRLCKCLSFKTKRHGRRSSDPDKISSIHMSLLNLV